jgi:hypothetical protein
MEYDSVTQKVLFCNTVLTALMPGRKYVIPQNGDCSRKSNVYFGFLKQSPLQKCNVVTELSMDKIHLQIMLSDVGQSNFKRLVMFCTQKEQENQTLHRKKLIKSRKCFL